MWILRFFIIIGIASCLNLYSQTGESETAFRRKLSQAALSVVNPNVTYDPQYFSIDYPMGDVPAGKGVCTDVIIRIYRKSGIDLQEKVHLDMKNHFEKYPDNWGLKRPDPNIDHRRVPNLMVFFKRHGKTLPTGKIPENYLPGDIVVWNLGNGILHIGMVVPVKSEDGKRYKVIHNLGNGQIVEDVLFHWEITGHYYYQPD
jgi:uncharacterized protein YijF (DUF1287 family)